MVNYSEYKAKRLFMSFFLKPLLFIHQGHVDHQRLSGRGHFRRDVPA